MSTIHHTPNAPDDEPRAITLRIHIIEAIQIWEAFNALGKQPAHFDSAHPLYEAKSLLETIRAAMIAEHPEDAEMFACLPHPRPSRELRGDPPRRPGWQC